VTSAVIWMLLLSRWTCCIEIVGLEGALIYITLLSIISFLFICLQPKCDYESTVRADISAFIHIYRPDHALTGRAIARVMHGIESPCFPAAVWGKVRRFWRCHLDVDFNLLRKIATEEMIRTRWLLKSNPSWVMISW